MSLESGFVNLEWTETSDVQSEPATWRLERGRISGMAIAPIAMGHPVQPAVMVGAERSNWSALKPRAEAKAWLTRLYFSF